MKTNLPFVFKRVFYILSEMELWSSSKRVVFVFFWHPPLSDLLSYSCCLPASRVLQFYSSVQLSCSVVSDCLRPHELQHTRLPCPSPSHRVCSIETMMPSNHLILCRPLLLLPSIFPSIRVFSSESLLQIRWPEYWSFSNSPSSEYSVLISFTID